MSSTFKNRILLITVILLLIPFVLITDLFPFLRFGMFAEPVREQVQTEVFLLLDGDSRSVADPGKIGFHGSSFQYLARNYFYRNQTGAFLEKLGRLDSAKKPYSLVKISFPPGFPEQADTVFLGPIQTGF